MTVIGVLIYTDNNLSTLEGLKAGMRERGYEEGKNVRYLFDGSIGRQEDLAVAAAKLVALNPDLIYTGTTPATKAMQQATSGTNIPVVFGPVNDPVAAGLIREQRQPGGNLTGVMLSDSTGKQLEWALRIKPDIRKVFFPYNPDDTSAVMSLKRAREAAGLLNLTLVDAQVKNSQELDRLIANFPEGMDAIFVPRDAMIMAKTAEIGALAKKRGLAFFGTRIEVARQGLFSYGFDGFELGRQVSRLAELILQGKNPSDLPTETAEEFLAVNLKTAQAIGLTIDDHILRLARQIIRD